MSVPSLTTSVVVASHNVRASLARTIESVLWQDSDQVECIVVDLGSTDGSVELLSSFQDRLTYQLSEPGDDTVRALNRAFTESSGEVMAWLEPGEMLCPWACRLVATIFNTCRQVDWLTSGTPMQWSPSGMLMPVGLFDGFSRETFFKGRNLKTSHYFHHPIRREGTFWRRVLWERSGGYIRALCQDAGDFELWTRFWEFAALATVNLPLGGRRMTANTPESQDLDYWRKAESVLSAHGGKSLTANWLLRLCRPLIRRVPGLAGRLGSPAQYVWMAARECGVGIRYIL